MITFSVKIKTIGLMCVGWSHPSAAGCDIPFTRVLRKKGREYSYEIYIPGSSFKGSLRSATSRIATPYGFKSCGEISPEGIERAHSSGGVCDVCELFGYPKGSVPSKLLVSDFEPVNHMQMFEMTRVRIDDQSMKAAEGALFTLEYVPPGSVFSGNISVREENPRLLGLLLLGLAELRIGRFGRASIIDLMIEDEAPLREKLERDWLVLLEDLRRWLWE
ncbi:MAG: hypothetical protein HA496_02200 [Thaumarchaeota archaeon]|nr:hypothetical protein [Nitrososphaerota archaeon]